MNDIKVAELINLNIDYNSGQMQNILYRCGLIGPFLMDISHSNIDLINAFSEWLDLLDLYNIELIESFIEVYSYNSIQGIVPRMYSEYPEYFEKMVNFVLGKDKWQPDTETRRSAEASSKRLTAGMLNHIYSKS